MKEPRLILRVHALKRMALREISQMDVRHVARTGETIETYPQDLPCPSRLVLGWVGERPIHLVVADDETREELIVITVYEPNTDKWEPGFARRKRR